MPQQTSTTQYSHTQTGELMQRVMIGLFLLYTGILYQAGFDWRLLTVVGLVSIIISGFNSLTVRIDQSKLHLKFGRGIYQTSFPLSQIKEIKQVKNKWWYGRGIRVRFRPMMIIFNVSGLDAVEIIMETGKIYRIGTDEPVQLTNALQQAVDTT